MILGKKIEPASTKNWKITEDRFVGYIDIMGFKDMVARNKHEDIYEMMNILINELEISEELFGMNRSKDDDEGSLLVKTTTYSDSILIYSKDGSKQSFNLFTAAMSRLHGGLFTNKIPHKGAIAFGKMTLDFDRSIFFGQPLIDAYLLQEELNFYGIVCHATAENNFYGNPKDYLLFEHRCPFKTGNGIHYAIFPMGLIFDKEMETDIKKLKSITSGGLRKYIDNTLEFVNSVKLTWKEITP